MTQEAKAKKIIEKAVSNTELMDFSLQIDAITGKNKHYALLFDKSFAKAIWGEKFDESKPYFLREWQYHLQQAVISENPIDYYYENMEAI